MIKFKRKNDYDNSFINDLINDFEKEIKGKIFETDEEAEQFYINKFGMEKYKSSMYEFRMTNALNRVCPKKLSENQKRKLFLLLKESNCKADIYMSYQDILELKKDTKK